MYSPACKCAERRNDLARRKWEIARKTGKGAWVHCLSCGAVWYTEAQYVAGMPYSIGPVKFQPPALQHTKCYMALVMLAATVLWSRDRFGVLEPSPGMLEKTWEAIEACRPSVRRRKCSVAARAIMEDMREIADAAMADAERESRYQSAVLFIGLDTYLCGAIATCPEFTSGPAWQVLRRLSDRWAEFWLKRCPDAEAPAEDLYERLLEETRR